MNLIKQNQDYLLLLLASLLLAIIIRPFVIKLFYRFMDRLVKKTSLRRIKKHFFPAIFILIFFVILKLLVQLYLNYKSSEIPTLNFMLFISATWVLGRFVTYFLDNIYSRFNYHRDQNNLKLRKIHTQLIFLEKTSLFIIWFVGLSLSLLAFEGARQFSRNILASAGVASIIIGFAAQKTLANLIASFQIAFSQPIRIDDVVIIEGEWGHVEEINLTYVVVRIWDKRRLVVPVTYFVEKPFQNWTRETSDILGTATFFLHYSADIEKLREDYLSILKASPLWDGQVAVLQVVGTTEKCLELRALMSAKDSPSCFDLRCEVREKLLNILQKKYPQDLPALKVEKG